MFSTPSPIEIVTRKTIFDITAPVNQQPKVFKTSRGFKIPVTWWICAVLVLGITATYWAVFSYGFIDYDDPEYVWQNPQVLAGLSWPGTVWAFTTIHASNWHPLTWLSHMLDVQLYGMHAGGHHATNVLFHAANTVLLFLLLKRLTSATWRSAFVAALFAFHPLHVESVAWIAERKDVLSTFFFLLTLLAYASYAKKQETRSNEQEILENRSPFSFLLSPVSQSYFLALFFFALGLLSKPMLVTLPFVLLLLDYWPLGRVTRLRPATAWQASDEKADVQTLGATKRSKDSSTSWRDGAKRRQLFRLLLEKVPFFALSAASCVVTILAQRHALASISELPFEARLQNAIASCLFYLEKTFWPVPLVPFYPYTTIDPETTAIAAFTLLMISGAVFISLRRRPYLAVGWLWFLGTLIPVIGLVQVGSQSMADRYTYVPLIGIFIAMVWWVGDGLQRQRGYRLVMTTVAVVGILGICLTLTAAQVRWWRNSETLARHALAVTTSTAPMQVLLGNALLRQNKPGEAAEHFAEAARLCPDKSQIQCNLAMALAAEGRIDEAIAVNRNALKIDPNDSRSHYLQGNLLATQARYGEAIKEYGVVLLEDPDYLVALNDLAWLLATAPEARFRNGAEAVTLAEKVCRLTNYKLPLFVGTLAAAYAEAGRYDDAAKMAEQAIALATAQNKKLLVDKNRELLELYQSQKAYHEPARQ
jgi:tetratricopeptide (TPR) repeat protein